MPFPSIQHHRTSSKVLSVSAFAIAALSCQATPAPPIHPVLSSPASASTDAIATAPTASTPPRPSPSTSLPSATPPSVSTPTLATTATGSGATTATGSGATTATGSGATTATGSGATARDWDRRLTQLYSSYSNGTRARAETYRQFFAPKLKRYLGMRDITLETAIQQMEVFFRTRSSPYYVVRGPVESPSSAAASASVEASWDEACPSEWAQDNFVCQLRLRLNVHATADERGQIEDFVETAGPKFRYRVEADTISGYEAPHSGCEELRGISSDVDLRKGTIVQGTGRYIQSFGCGPCERLVQFLHDGAPYWTILASCIRIYDEETGPHTGGEDFLIELD
ncbi:MAG: hypothetical protein QM784_10760 [Polyangiaceae bacterium]